MNEIKIKLTIDNREVNGSLALTDEQIRKIYSSVETLSTSPLLKQFAQDLINIGSVSDEAAQGIQDFIKYNQLSEKEIQSVIRALEQEKSVLPAGSAEYLQRQTAIQNITNAYTRMNPNIASGTSALMTQQKGLTGFNMMIGQTGFLLSDMDMFFVNFRMGLLSIGNNISMVASTVGIAMNQAKESNLSFGAALKQSLTGFNLWLLGINAGMFVIQMLARILSSTTEEVKKQKDEIAALEKQYAQLSTTQAAYERGRLIQQLAEKGAIYRKGFMGGPMAWDISGVSSNDQEEVSKLMNSLKALDQQAAITAEKVNNILLGNWNWRSVASINEAVALLRKEYDNAESDASREFLEKYINVLEAKAKQLGFDSSTSKSIKEKDFIVTNQQLEDEIKLLKQKADATQNLAEKILYLQQVEQREAEIRFRNGIGNTPVTKIAPKTENLPTSQNTDEKGMLHYLNDPEAAKAYKEITDFNTQLIGETVVMDAAFRHLGQTISRTFASGIMQGKHFLDILSDVLGMFAQMGLEGVFMGLLELLLPGPGTFLTGFKKAFGFAEGGIINEPIFGIGKSGTSYMMGEAGKELILPLSKYDSLIGAMSSRNINHTITVKVEGESTISGYDLHTLWKKVDKIEKRFR